VVYDPTSPRGVAIGPIGGAVDPLQRLLGEELLGLEVDAVAVVGDLGAALSKPDAYRAVFNALGETGLPAFWIPGPIDAPISEYLRESHTIEIALPPLRGIHGTAAVPNGHVFAGPARPRPRSDSARASSSVRAGSTSGSVPSSTSIQARSRSASRPV
jgi:hypothetical protein